MTRMDLTQIDSRPWFVLELERMQQIRLGFVPQVYSEVKAKMAALKVDLYHRDREWT